MTVTDRGREFMDLDDALAGEADLVGGKAAGLARLRAAGFPVPEGWVIPVGADVQAVTSAATAVARACGGRLLAVRSSGVAEDLADASFAGQYETVLGVAPEADAIADAVQRVFESGRATHLGAYGHGAAEMAVLVMPMIDADAAGIAFTQDPVTGADEVVIEAVAGLADRLAAGEADPETWRRRGSAKPHTDSPANVMDAETAGEVADLSRRVETWAGCPQDIEWALTGGEVVLLQARPITTASEVEPVPIDVGVPPGVWERDTTHLQTPATPLAASVFEEAFTKGSLRLVEEYGVPIARLEMKTLGGYYYIQVVPAAGKPGAAPPPKWLMKILCRVAPPFRRRERTARKALATRRDRQLAEQWRNEVRPDSLAKLSEWVRTDLTALSDADLARHLDAAARAQIDAFGWNMVTDPSYLIPLVRLHEFLDTHLSEGMETTAALLSGSAATEYRRSIVELSLLLAEDAEASRIIENGDDVVDKLERSGGSFGRAYRRHLDRFGLRIWGYDVDTPTLIEQPEIELARLRSGITATDRAGDEAAELGRSIRARLDVDIRPEFDRLLDEARRAYPIREDGETIHAACAGAVRLAGLEVGRRMVSAGVVEDREHAVFLTVEELIDWLGSRYDVSETVRRRRGERRWAMSNPGPLRYGPEVPEPDPEVFPPGIREVFRVQMIVVAHDMRPPEDGGGDRGVGGSPGLHTGPVRVVHGPEEFWKVRPGDVMVCPVTASPWEVVFPDLGALVTESGGILSHPAIVAREHGIPAVLAVEGATRRFEDGQIVTVDGTAGTVSVRES